MKIVVLGKNGMVAHMVHSYLKEKNYNIEAISIRNKPIDNIEIPKCDIIINCVGILVNESAKHNDRAVYYNSYLPHYLAFKYRNTSTKIVHISTDCVFDDTFYGKTKNLGEVDNSKDLTLRMSIIGADTKKTGTGLFNWFIQQEGSVDGYSLALWNGITNLQLAKSLPDVWHLTGIHNLVTEHGISKLYLLELIKKTFSKNIKIKPVKIGTDKRLPSEHIPLPDYETMLNELKEWITKHEILYPQY